MRLPKPLLFVVLLLRLHAAFSQCLLPSPNGDTITPVISRMRVPVPLGSNGILDQRNIVSKMVNVGNTMFIGGSFSYIGPNTGTGVVMSTDATQSFSPKKWRINGLVYTSVPDGAGGFFIGGAFTMIGDSARYDLAHINSNGQPDNWKPRIDNIVKAMVIKNDSLIIGGQFTQVNGQGRNSLAMLNTNVDTLLPPITANSALVAGTLIHTFTLVDSNLFVGGNFNIYNTVGSAFKVNLNNGGASNIPVAYNMEDVYAIELSADKKRIYVGGHYGGVSPGSNGYCLSSSNGSVLYKMDVGTVANNDVAAIYSIKAYGPNIYLGGMFDKGNIGGNGFNQVGVVVFDTASAQLKNVLTNCDGLVSYINTNAGKVYIGGEFSSIGGQSRADFAIYDTALLSVATNTLTASDQVKTISFSGSKMFVGGYFQSVNGVPRTGFAAYDLTTGNIKSWAPTFSIVSLSDMEAKGDTIFLAGSFSQKINPTYLGGLLAVDTVMGNYYSALPIVSTIGYDILIDSNFLYLGSSTGVGKYYIPTLNLQSSWIPGVGFDAKILQKKSDKIYVLGDDYRTKFAPSQIYLAEIDNPTGSLTRSISLTPPPLSSNAVHWVSSGILVGDKLFLSGEFDKILYTPRLGLAAIDIASFSLTTVQSTLPASRLNGGFIMIGSALYLYNSGDSINGRPQQCFYGIDTATGGPYPDLLHIDEDNPFGSGMNITDDGISTARIVGSSLILGGDFRTISQQMFPTLAKLAIVTGGGNPIKPQGISGPATITCPSTGNVYKIINPNPGYTYHWFYTGQNATINGNGADSILFDMSKTASPGSIQTIARNECGETDTVSYAIHLNTLQPDTNASNIRLVRKTDTTATIKFTPGNGASRLVIIHASTTISQFPMDGQDYTANNAFGQGSDVGGNTYVVYRGNGDSVDLKKLSSATVYSVTVFEFNGTAGATNYLTSGNSMLSFTTFATEPTVPSTNLVFSNRTVNSVTINCTPGNGQKRLVIIRKGPNGITQPTDAVTYNASTVFGNGSDVGNLSFVVSNTSTPITVSGLQEVTQYVVSVFEFSGQDSSTNYLLTNAPTVSFYTLASEPTLQATNISVSSITTTTATINCTPGNGALRLVVVRQGSTIVDTPVDHKGYNYQPFFGAGSSIGHNSVVTGISTPNAISNLLPGRTYYIKIFEFNGSDTNSNYLVNNAPADSFTTTVAPPTVQASSLYASGITNTSFYLNCSAGNGTDRIMVLKEGSPITNTPADGIDYTANAIFGSGSDLGNGTYVVGKGLTVNVLNLKPNTTYYAEAFEFNGTGSLTRYLIAGAPVKIVTTTTGGVAEPTLQASNLVITNVTSSSATINCSAGNGANRLVVLKANVTTVTAQPVDGIGYTGNSTYSLGDNLGDGTYVISAINTPVTVTGLSSNTNYAVSVFEYNGSGTNANYLLVNNPIATFKTTGQQSKPTIPASNITISNITQNAATIEATPGDGQNRLVVISMGTSISTSPIDAKSYNANTTFGLGSDLGNQTYVVSTTNTPVTITGLTSNSDFTVSVFEYDGSGANSSYLVAGNPTATFHTLIAQAQKPTVQAQGITVTGITSSSATINCTAGNGANRLVVITQSSTVSATPIDGTAYSANTIFSSGSNIGNQTYVISATSTPITVTGLSSGSTFTVSVFEYNGSSSTTSYLTTNNPTLTFQTFAQEPSTQAQGILIDDITDNSATINCIAGDGSNRLVVIKADTAINAIPNDGTSYTADPIFGNGSDLGAHTYVVSTSQLPVIITGLSRNANYSVKVFEFNGSGSTANYLTANTTTAGFRTSLVTSVTNLGPTGTTLQIAPNPVINDRINITFTTIRPGTFKLEIFTIAGVKLLTKSISMSSGTNNTSVMLAHSSAQMLIVKCTFNGYNKSLLILKTQ